MICTTFVSPDLGSRGSPQVPNNSWLQRHLLRLEGLCDSCLVLGQSLPDARTQMNRKIRLVAPIQKIANVQIGMLGTSQSSDVMNFPALQRRNYKKKFKETLESTGEMRQMWIEHTKSLKKSASKFSQSNQETPNRTTPYE